MDTIMTLLNCLKSKRIITDVDKAKAEVISEDVTLKKSEDLFIRDAITGLGTILKEDLELHYYITSVKVGAFGNVLAYAIIARNEEMAQIAVYAHEGLIKQHLADKTIQKLKTVLC